MPNIFKNNSNNRFQFLDDSEPTKDKYNNKSNNNENTYKNNRQRDNNINSFKFTENINNKKVNNEIKIIEEEFPELSSLKQHNFDNNTNTNINKNINTKVYKNLFHCKDEDKNNINYIQEEFIPDGCICISYNKTNGKIEYKKGKLEHIKKRNTHDVMNDIAKFYEKRKNEYINSWDLDTYEDTFLFKNYDYNYFDKLDIQYEIEMENLNEEIISEEQLENIDDYY